VPDQLDYRGKVEKLRQKAERIVKARNDFPDHPVRDEMEKFVEELQVLQIALQLQNEELRESSKNLEESQARYAELYHSAPLGYVTLNNRGIIIQANQAASRMLDVPPEHMEGRGFSQLIVDADHPKYFNLINQLIKSKTTQHSAELRMLKGGAVPFHVEMTINSSVYKDDRFDGWRIVFSDISKRKKAEQALQQSEEKYRSVFAAATDAIIIADTGDGRILDVNDHACELYGYSQDEMSGLKVFDLSAEQAETRLAAAAEVTRIPVRYHKKKNGVVFPVEISVSYVTHGERRVATSVIRDISERLRKEKALQKSEEQLRYLSAQLLSIQEKERQTLAKELHDEVSTPLSAIKYYAENLFDQTDPAAKDSARRAQFKRLIDIIQDTMEASQRMMTNLRPSVLDDFGIIATIKWLCRQLRRSYKDMQVDFEGEVQEDEVPQSLKSTLFRIAQEALHNAARHSRAKHLKIALVAMEHSLQLKIEDDGAGFDQKSTELYRNGFGILSMKERAELTGGSFLIESPAGRGTTVIASWPLHPTSGNSDSATIVVD